MKKILELISEEMQKAFEEAGYNKELGRVTVSNRPDLCEYQCNGAMALAKAHKKAPIMIANELVEKGYPYTLTKDGRRNFSMCEGVDVSELWLYDKVEFIDDIPVVSLLGVYLLKKDLNREKDQKDLKVLEAILFPKK